MPLKDFSLADKIHHIHSLLPQQPCNLPIFLNIEESYDIFQNEVVTTFTCNLVLLLLISDFEEKYLDVVGNTDNLFLLKHLSLSTTPC